MRKRTTCGPETALEQVLTNSYKASMISYLAIHPEDFEEAIQGVIFNKIHIHTHTMENDE